MSGILMLTSPEDKQHSFGTELPSCNRHMALNSHVDRIEVCSQLAPSRKLAGVADCPVRAASVGHKLNKQLGNYWGVLWGKQPRPTCGQNQGTSAHGISKIEKGQLMATKQDQRGNPLVC